MSSEKQLDDVKAAIRARLMHLCSHMSEESFEQLVHKIALNAIKQPNLGEWGKGGGQAMP